MTRKNFIQNIEDFTCEHCQVEVKGSGYTNHCPECLWSKHVDNVPGDRANACCGLMEPVGVEIHGKDQDIVHRCTACGVTKRNKRADSDRSEAIVAITNHS